jgi:hypothetical protein
MAKVSSPPERLVVVGVAGLVGRVVVLASLVEQEAVAAARRERPPTMATPQPVLWLAMPLQAVE